MSGLDSSGKEDWIMSDSTERYRRLWGWTLLVAFVLRTVFSWSEVTGYVTDGKIAELVYTVFGCAGEAITLSAIIMWLFDRSLWKLPIINSLTGGMPVLAHEYEGVLVFERDGVTDSLHEKSCKLRVVQTFQSVSVVLETDESRSVSTMAAITLNDVDKRLVYTYVNEPDLHLRGKSDMHHGTAELHIDGTERLQGSYYTSRQTCGSMRLCAIDGSKGGTVSSGAAAQR